MKSRAERVERVREYLDYHERQADALRKQLDKLQFPKEPKGQGTVIKFLVQHHEDGPVFQYWAVRFGTDTNENRWVITGKQRSKSWPDVVELMRLDVGIQAGARDVEFSVVSK